MKIGLISLNAYSDFLNQATPLHTYVLQEFLRDHDIDSTIIDYKPNYIGDFDRKNPLFYYIDHPLENEKKQELQLKIWRTWFYERMIRYEKQQNFINTYYKKTDRCYTEELLDEVDAGFDCYICATDVIWKSTAAGFDRGYFLACETMKGKKKIAYAASRGAKQYTPEQEKEFLKYISDMDYVAVRERSLKEYIYQISGKDVPHVIDAVFLKDRDFYDQLAMKPERPEKNYVLIYIVAEENNPALVREAVRFAQERDLEIIELSGRPGNAHIPKRTYHDVLYDIGVEEWLWYMKEAEYIFTNSFHACCFSVIFERQFFAGPRAGDKIDSFLEMTGLTWRRTSKERPGGSLEMEEIDYTKIRPVVEEYTQYSKKYLLNAIEQVRREFEESAKG